MRATVGCFACLAAVGGVAFATPQGNPTPADSIPTYYLRGYYKIDNQSPAWQKSNSSPWTQVKRNTPWVNPRLVKWGYVPFAHDSANYYCLIQDGPQTGSHVVDKIFLCGEPDTVQWLFQNHWAPTLPMIGGGPLLESSLRPRPSNGN
jgi:hypothetical protein